MHRTLWCPKLQLIVLHIRTSRVCELLRSGSLIARSHNRSLITKTIYLNEHDLYVFYTKKLLLIHPVMCAAVVAFSLAILLLCFITFIAFYCQLRLSTVNKVYDDEPIPART